MNIKQLHHSLNSEHTQDTKRQELIAYLKECTDNLPDDDKERRLIAYNAASLLSTDFARSLREDDVLDDVLTLAGELEIPDKNAETKWQEFQHLVRLL